MKSINFILIGIAIVVQSCSIPAEKWIAYPNPTGAQLSFDQAFEEIKEFRKDNPKKKAVLILSSGEYHISKTIEIGQDMSYVTIRSEDGGRAWIKGSEKIDVSWERQGPLLVTPLDGIKKIDQLYVDGRMQILARYPNYIENGGHWQGHAEDAINPERVASWNHPEGAIIHAMHGSEWGDFHFVLEGIDEYGDPILSGGHQNNRPNRMHTKYRMVENVFEELDSPGEWYFNSSEGNIYWYPDEFQKGLESQIEIPLLNEMIVVNGSKENPVKEFILKGIGFTHSSRTFMEEYEPLLRSDWTIFRGGAIFYEGSENCEISDCFFTELGGNALFVSGYNRDVKIISNHIHEIGASGICLVGKPKSVRSPSFQYGEYVSIEMMDTVRGPKTDDYPANVLIDNNLIYRTGRIEKQTAGIQLSMCMHIHVSRNSIYDVPRAGINISEGTWGGHIIEFNDVFETVQESGDHGSFNSWGRDRFWHPNRRTLDSLTLTDPQMPLWDAIHTTIIRNNRFRCDHGWDIDLDDGSSNYEIYNNLCLNGGIKLREGFYRKVENNIMINNGFHPHVWFSNSEDIFRHNIVLTDHKDIRLAAWGKEVDFNLFPTKEALLEAQGNLTDKNSLFGDPDFIAPEKGDFRVTDSSPAIKIGFKNFDMDQFGVQVESLKKIRKEPEIPILFIPEFQKEKKSELMWMGATIKNLETMAERSAAGMSDENGVMILDVNDGSPASKAGLRTGDVIIGCEGQQVNRKVDLLNLHQGNNWKGKLSLKIFRNQSENEVVIITK